MTEKESFLNALKNRILLFDGAMGTEIQSYDPSPEDFPNNQDGFNDGLILTHPDWIKEIHRNYLDAGSDCIETNSFGSNKIKLDEYGFGDQTVDFNKTADLAEVAVKDWNETLEKIELTKEILGALLKKLEAGNDGTLAKILNDPRFQSDASKEKVDYAALLEDIRLNPSKYTYLLSL